MHVAIDTARKDEKAGRIDDLCRTTQLLSKRDDHTASDSEVTPIRIRRGRYGSAANHKIETQARLQRRVP